MRLLARFKAESNPASVVADLVGLYHNLDGVDVKLTDTVDHKTYLEVRYVVVGKVSPHTVYITCSRNPRTPARWRRVSP